jgi:hypothetical protein
LLSGGAAITGKTSMATSMAPVRTRFLFISFPSISRPGVHQVVNRRVDA